MPPPCGQAIPSGTNTAAPLVGKNMSVQAVNKLTVNWSWARRHAFLQAFSTYRPEYRHAYGTCERFVQDALVCAVKLYFG